MAIYLASFTRKYSKIYTYKKVYIKAGWQPSDKFSPDSLIHSTTFRRKNPRIPETRVPSQRWQLKKSRENARVLHANVLIPPPLPLPKLQPPPQTMISRRETTASHNPVEMREGWREEGWRKRKKKEQAENCMETNGRKMIDERRAKGWTRNPQETIGFTIWTVQCFNTDLDLHRGRKRREKKSGNYKSAFCI